MVTLLVIDELERIWKEAIVAFQGITQFFPWKN
jgi:hypothetical protein